MRTYLSAIHICNTYHNTYLQYISATKLLLIHQNNIEVLKERWDRVCTYQALIALTTSSAVPAVKPWLLPITIWANPPGYLHRTCFQHADAKSLLNRLLFPLTQLSLKAVTVEETPETQVLPLSNKPTKLSSKLSFYWVCLKTSIILFEVALIFEGYLPRVISTCVVDWWLIFIHI